MALRFFISQMFFKTSSCSKIYGSIPQRERKRPWAPGWEPKAPCVARLPLQPLLPQFPAGAAPSCLGAVSWGGQATSGFHVFGHRIPLPWNITLLFFLSWQILLFLQGPPPITPSLWSFFGIPPVTICISTSPCFAYFTPLITLRAMIFLMSVSPMRPCTLCISWVKNCDVKYHTIKLKLN